MGGARIWWIALVTALLPTAAEGRGRYLRVSSENEAISIFMYVCVVRCCCCFTGRRSGPSRRNFLALFVVIIGCRRAFY